MTGAESYWVYVVRTGTSAHRYGTLKGDGMPRRRLVRTPTSPNPHPYDTNDYVDLPQGIKISFDYTIKNRINAVCEDVHHCTIANAMASTASSTGITELGRRGVSKSYVCMRLDSKVHLWADPDTWYRGQLTPSSADVVAELDDKSQSPTQEAGMKRGLKAQALKLPDGLDSVLGTVTIVAPYRKKGYRAGAEVRGRTGSGTKAGGSIKRRAWKPESKTL